MLMTIFICFPHQKMKLTWTPKKEIKKKKNNSFFHVHMESSISLQPEILICFNHIVFKWEFFIFNESPKGS